MPSSVIYGKYISIPRKGPSDYFYRCMEHSVDLSAKTFVQAISPSPARNVLRKIKNALQVTSNVDSNTVNLDELDAHLGNFDFDNNSEDEEDEGDDGNEEALDAEGGPADALGKALLLVKQVCTLQSLLSSQALTHGPFRFVLLLRLGHFSRNLANRLKYQFFSFSSGFVLDGPLCTHSWTGF